MREKLNVPMKETQHKTTRTGELTSSCNKVPSAGTRHAKTRQYGLLGKECHHNITWEEGVDKVRSCVR